MTKVAINLGDLEHAIEVSLNLSFLFFSFYSPSSRGECKGEKSKGRGERRRKILI